MKKSTQFEAKAISYNDAELLAEGMYGLKLIIQEREEQIHKHNFNDVHDAGDWNDGGRYGVLLLT